MDLDPTSDRVAIDRVDARNLNQKRDGLGDDLSRFPTEHMVTQDFNRRIKVYSCTELDWDEMAENSGELVNLWWYTSHDISSHSGGL
jgi:hypothetical protein